MNSDDYIGTKYIILELLGSGYSANVYLCSNKAKANDLYAIKVFKSGKNNEKEVQISNLLKNGNVINIVDSGTALCKIGNEIAEKSYLVLEYAQNKELYYFLKDQKGFGEELGRIIFAKLLNAVESCHKSGIIHGDLKLENILLTDAFVFKLCDFGFSSVITNSKICTDFRGTQGYRAPEIIVGIPYDGEKSDLFSLGVVLFIVVLGIPPFRDAKNSDSKYQYFAIKKPYLFWRLFPTSFMLSDDFKSLVNLLLEANPSKRATLEQIREHPWVQQGEGLNEVLLTNELERRLPLAVEIWKREKDN